MRAAGIDASEWDGPARPYLHETFGTGAPDAGGAGYGAAAMPTSYGGRGYLGGFASPGGYSAPYAAGAPGWAAGQDILAQLSQFALSAGGGQAGHPDAECFLRAPYPGGALADFVQSWEDWARAHSARTAAAVSYFAEDDPVARLALIGADVEARCVPLFKAVRLVAPHLDPATAGTLLHLLDRAQAPVAELGAASSIVAQCFQQNIDVSGPLAHLPHHSQAPAYAFSTASVTSIVAYASRGRPMGDKRKSGAGFGVRGGGQDTRSGWVGSGGAPWPAGPRADAGSAAPYVAPNTRAWGKGGKRSRN